MSHVSHRLLLACFSHRGRFWYIVLRTVVFFGHVPNGRVSHCCPQMQDCPDEPTHGYDGEPATFCEAHMAVGMKVRWTNSQTMDARRGYKYTDIIRSVDYDKLQDKYRGLCVWCRGVGGPLSGRYVLIREAKDALY